MADAAKRPFEAYQDANLVLMIAMGIGLVAPFGFAIQGGAARFVQVAAVGLGAIGAALTVGAVLGFIFGIPRSLQEGPTSKATAATDETASTPAERLPYAGNTSLEQISDWLTKILVGVGLTQIANVPGALASIGDFFAGGLGDVPGAREFAVGLVVFGLIDGFFVSYLWTRLYLPGLFAESDARTLINLAEKRGRAEGEKRVVDAAANVADDGEAKPADEASRILALWVDDHPENNESERRWLSSLLPISWLNVTSTERALEAFTRGTDTFAFLITDMGRRFDPRAGYTLLQEMRGRGIQTPVIIYAGSSAPEYDQEARQAGALGSTNSPSRLLELISQVVRPPTTAG